MTRKVLAVPSQLKPVSFWPSTVLLSVCIIYIRRKRAPLPLAYCHIFTLPRSISSAKLQKLLVARLLTCSIKSGPYCNWFWPRIAHLDRKTICQTCTDCQWTYCRQIMLEIWFKKIKNKNLHSHLDVDLIVSWTMYGPIEPKSHHKYSAVHRKPVRNLNENVTRQPFLTFHLYQVHKMAT